MAAITHLTPLTMCANVSRDNLSTFLLVVSKITIPTPGWCGGGGGAVAGENSWEHPADGTWGKTNSAICRTGGGSRRWRHSRLCRCPAICLSAERLAMHGSHCHMTSSIYLICCLLSGEFSSRLDHYGVIQGGSLLWCTRRKTTTSSGESTSPTGPLKYLLLKWNDQKNKNKKTMPPLLLH